MPATGSVSTTRPGRDPRTLFDIDERLAELIDQIEMAAEEGQEPPAELIEQIDAHIDAFHNKVDRIAGYLRWQESIELICRQEAERLTARRKAAESRVLRLRNLLQYFMLSRGLKKLEGERASFALQQNSAASLVVDDQTQVSRQYFERQIALSRDELDALIHELPEGAMKNRLEALAAADGWQLNGSAIRTAILNGASIDGARLVKGHHVRLR